MADLSVELVALVITLTPAVRVSDHLGWEVVQLAVQQILDLLILVRVQASQPISFLR
jgi:hypothetical protein